MRFLGLFILKKYLQLGLFFYFGSIRVKGLNKVVDNKPNLILCNHQNALLDALLIATRLPGYPYFLTRASVFKKNWIDRLLRAIGLLPVYRIRDGWSNLSNNAEIFEQCTELLNENRTVVIFPEGSHNLARRVRPLSKGFTRIVENSLSKYPEMELYLTPAGVSYRNAMEFPDYAALEFSDSFLVKEVLSNAQPQDFNMLKQMMYDKIAGLTVNIPKDSYDQTLAKLEDINADFLQVEIINRTIESGFSNKTEIESYRPNKLMWLLKQLQRVLLIIPFLIWRLAIKPKIVEKEFTSTFRFAVAVVLVPLYLFSFSVVASYFLPLSIIFEYLVAVLLTQLLILKLQA